MGHEKKNGEHIWKVPETRERVYVQNVKVVLLPWEMLWQLMRYVLYLYNIQTYTFSKLSIFSR